MVNKVIVKRTGRTWGMFQDGVLVQGGFFSAEAARECAAEMEADFAAYAAQQAADQGKTLKELV